MLTVWLCVITLLLWGSLGRQIDVQLIAMTLSGKVGQVHSGQISQEMKHSGDISETTRLRGATT